MLNMIFDQKMDKIRDKINSETKTIKSVKSLKKVLKKSILVSTQKIQWNEQKLTFYYVGTWETYTAQ